MKKFEEPSLYGIIISQAESKVIIVGLSSMSQDRPDAGLEKKK